jgi:hypothetical protein
MDRATPPAIVKRFQSAAAAPTSHRKDILHPEVQVYRVKIGPERDLRFVRVRSKDLTHGRPARIQKIEGAEETTPELKAQIREGYEAYMRGDVRPVDELLAELEAELSE